MEYQQSLQVRFREKMKTPYNYTTMYILTVCNLQESIEKLESEIQLLRTSSTTHHSPSNRGGGDSERVEGLTSNPLYIPHITLPVSTTILCTCMCSTMYILHVHACIMQCMERISLCRKVNRMV